jgi:uncharacterized protein YkwD
MINRRTGLALLGAATLAACAAPAIEQQLGPDGKPLPQVYRINPGDEGKVTYNMLDSINALRGSAGAPPLQLNAQLTAAAATHSRDMSVQNRPWHFGSDGSSALSRVQRAGYTGRMLGENISETYENETQTLTAWMELADTRAVLMDRNARDLGFSWFQEPGGKIWWTLVTGG